MRLEEKIHTSGNFELSELLANAKADVSAFGSSYITVDGYDGYMYLSDLTIDLFLRAFKNGCEHHFGLEGVPGALCARIVQTLYRETDNKVNLFGRILKIFSDFTNRYLIDKDIVRKQFLNLSPWQLEPLENVIFRQNPVNFEKIDQVLALAKTRVSFWGTRTITVEDYRGEMPIDRLAGYFTGISTSSANLNRGERKAALKIVRRVAEFYKQTDRFNPIQKAREFTFSHFTGRFYMEDYAEQAFLRFTREQFITCFPGRALPHEIAGSYTIPENDL